MPCISYSERPASSPITLTAQFLARWRWMSMPNHSANAGNKRVFGITRIGAHAGPAIVGNFGGGRFFDYTAYGDTINVASRLEVANKQLGTRVLVYRLRVKNFSGRPVGDLMLRGRTEAIRAFEPFQVGRYEPVAESYQKAFALLEAADPSAMAAFAAHVGNYPTDQLASFHLKRLLSGSYGAKIVLD